MTATGLIYTDTGKDVRSEAELRGFLIRQANGICQICGTAPATEADHVWPKRLGGPDHIGNRQAACAPCNKRKGDRVDMDSATAQQLSWGLQAFLSRAAAFCTEAWHFAFLLGQSDDPPSPERFRLVSEHLRQVLDEALDVEGELEPLLDMYREAGEP